MDSHERWSSSCSGCRTATPRWGFVSGDVTRAQYPFDFELVARYELEEPDGHGVRIEFPDFDYLIIWSKPAGDFVALEPWSGLSICSDEDDVFEHKRGCIVAARTRPSSGASRSSRSRRDRRPFDLLAN